MAAELAVQVLPSEGMVDVASRFTVGQSAAPVARHVIRAAIINF